MNRSLAGTPRRLVAALLLFALCTSGLFAAPALAEEGNHEPIYPSKSAGAPVDEEEDSSLRLPDLVAEDGDFHLAVIESAQPKIDNQKVLDGVREIMGNTNAKIVVGVDGPDNTWDGGAAQFTRGMTLFGPTSYLLLHEDWPDGVDSKGYIQDGWIVIGLILPDEAGKGAEIAIERAKDVKGDRAAALENSISAMRPAMDDQDYTQAVIEAVRSTTDELTASKYSFSRFIPSTSEGKKVLAFSVLGVLIGLGGIIQFIRYRRIARRKAVAGRTARAAELRDHLRSRSQKLLSCRLPEADLPAGGLAQQHARQIAQIVPALHHAAQQAADGVVDSQVPSPEALARLEQISSCQDAVISSFGAFNELLGREVPNQRSWKNVILAHRQILEASTELLDADKAASLDAAAELRAHLVTDTDVLIDARQWLDTPNTRTVTPVQMLETLWTLRTELDASLRRAAAAAKKQGVSIPGTVSSYLAGESKESELRADDLAKFARAAEQLQAWDGERAQDRV
ncbi:hypothetical protein [Glutamicibacter sp.]|uniref:hypothetical protein n=1 Tax=Glutamicibacter sp. TaxID=1931995 RepID=UPI0028BD168D|nr:hypothetical protein [Glutamicibacter sp.]